MSEKEGGTMWARPSVLVEGRVVRLVYRYKSSGFEKNQEISWVPKGLLGAQGRK